MSLTIVDNMKNLKILKKEFYAQKSTPDIAKSLLGKYLVRELENSILIGKIIEVEAYLQNDPAAHSYGGRSKRNNSLFEEAGTVYVYFTYGMHWCFNIAVNESGVGEGVLIRGVEPLIGVDTMLRNRGISYVKMVSNGPAKVTKAYQIGAEFDGHKIWEPPLYIATDDTQISEGQIEITPRIGISKNKDAMLRFVLKHSMTA